jgi:hypothetical protein
LGVVVGLASYCIPRYSGWQKKEKEKKRKKVPRLIPVVENNLVLMQRNIIFAECF